MLYATALNIKYCTVYILDVSKLYFLKHFIQLTKSWVNVATLK